MLGFFREQVLGPMLARRAGVPQRGVRRAEAMGWDPDGRLGATLARHDAASVRSALLAAIECYAELREDDPPIRRAPAMPETLLELIG